MTNSGKSGKIVKRKGAANWEEVEVRAAEPIQHGFQAFPKDDEIHENVKLVTPREAYYTKHNGKPVIYYDVAMHGSPNFVSFSGGAITPHELAEFIRHRDDYHGDPIRLLCCKTGKSVDGDYCFAEYLSNTLGVEVSAPNDTLYIDSNGNMYVGVFGQGKFETFIPNQRRRIK